MKSFLCSQIILFLKIFSLFYSQNLTALRFSICMYALLSSPCSLGIFWRNGISRYNFKCCLVENVCALDFVMILTVNSPAFTLSLWCISTCQ